MATTGSQPSDTRHDPRCGTRCRRSDSATAGSAAPKPAGRIGWRPSCSRRLLGRAKEQKRDEKGDLTPQGPEPLSWRAMTRCRGEYEALQIRTPEAVAELLVRNGARFDRELREQHLVDAFELCQGNPWFVPSALLALRWSRHAMHTDTRWLDYFNVGRRYMAGHEVLDEMRLHAGRFGPVAFTRALEGYRALFRARQRELFDRWPASPEDLLANQVALIGVFGANVLSGDTGSTVGIGPWLGLAPHKILLIWQLDWWTDSQSDRVMQPLGSVVTRALRRLARDRVIDREAVHLLPREAEDRADAYGTVVIAQGIQQRLADLVGGRVMHVNSGLYELGYEGPA